MSTLSLLTINRPIIYEGLDGSGKDFLKKAFCLTSEHKYICVSRMYISSLVYAKIFNREADYKRHVSFAKKFSAAFRPLIVFCDTSNSVLNSRINCRGEEALSDTLLNKTRLQFNLELSKYVPDMYLLRVDTTITAFDTDPLNDNVRAIATRLKILERRQQNYD